MFTDLHNEMLLQRSVDRRLIESFLGYKMWWRTIRFLFDSLKESNNLHAFQNEGNLLLEEPGKRVHFLDGEDLPLKEHRQLYATQRALFCTDHQDLQLEKNVWRDLTQEFCRKLAHDHHSTNVGHLHTQWLRTATQAFQVPTSSGKANLVCRLGPAWSAFSDRTTPPLSKSAVRKSFLLTTATKSIRPQTVHLNAKILFNRTNVQ